MLTLLSVLLLSFVQAQNQCDICPAGNYVDSLTGMCIPCPSGYFNPNPGQVGTGSTSSSCIKCGDGFGVTLDQSACLPCAAGKLSNSGICWDCRPGTYQPNKQVNDTYGNQTECIQCPMGQGPNADASGCVLCPEGYYSQSGQCYPCGQYYFSKGVGQTSDHCSSCGYGNEPNKVLAATDCVQCAPGKYSDDGYECYFCGYAAYSTKWGSTTSNDCLGCPAGTQPSANMDRCDECPPGTYSSDGGYCNPCYTGYNPRWGAQNSGDCDSCPLGYQPSTDYTRCEICPAGTYSDDGLGCYQCPALTVRLTPGATNSDECIACPTGMFEGYNNAYKCECPDGEYEDSNKSPSAPCTQCPVGKSAIMKTFDAATNSWIGGTVLGTQPDPCFFCPAGTYGVFVNISYPQGLCANCPDGTFQPQTGQTAATTCTNCADGTFSAAPNLANCTDCAPGTYGDPSHSFCNPCPGGTYNSNTGSTSSVACATCSAGKWSAAATTSCRDCPPGTFADPLNTYLTCRPCDYDTFNNNTGGISAAACLPCAAGRTISLESYSHGRWVPSPWRNCSSSCMTSRDVVCVDSLYRQVSDGNCLGSIKPPTTAVCDGDPTYAWAGTNANRCARDCGDSPMGNPAKNKICPDGTCVADYNDCMFGARFIQRKRVIDGSVPTLYKTNPAAVYTWVAAIEAGLLAGLFQNSQVRVLMLNPVTNWNNQPAVEVTFEFLPAAYPDEYFQVTLNSVNTGVALVCLTPPLPTMSSCMDLCYQNASCASAVYNTGSNGCCLYSTSVQTGGAGTFLLRLGYQQEQDPVAMNGQFMSQVPNSGSNMFQVLPALDPAWGWEWAAGPKPVSASKSSSIKVNKTAGIIAGCVIGGVLLLIVLFCIIKSCECGGGSKPSQEPYKDAVQLQPTNTKAKENAAESGTVVRNQGQPQQQQQQQQQDYNNQQYNNQQYNNQQYNNNAKQDPNGVWESVVSAEGHVYYVNRLTGESRWDIPASG